MTSQASSTSLEHFQPETTKEWRPDRLPETLRNILIPDGPASDAITPDAARELYRSRAYDHQHPKPRANPIYNSLASPSAPPVM